MTSPMRWNVVICLDEDYRRTRALARLRTLHGEQVGVGIAHRYPADPAMSGIGDELAAARALDDLGNSLIARATPETAGLMPPVWTTALPDDPAVVVPGPRRPSGPGPAPVLEEQAPTVEPALAEAKRWTVVVDVDDHGTAVRAVARLHDRTSDRLEGEGVGYVVPLEYPAPELGAGVATARALRRLSDRLVAAASKQRYEIHGTRDRNQHHRTSVTSLAR